MSMFDDLPTIGERYATAIESSNLRTKLDRACDTDVLMAAGWARGHARDDLGLGANLYRLRCEFDSVKAVMRLGNALSTTDRMLVLTELKSLASVKGKLNDDAISMAVDSGYLDVSEDGKIISTDETGKKTGKDMQDVFAVAGRALDLWLSPLCPDCEGVGKVGQLGNPQHVCGTCGGSGRRDAKSEKKKSAVFKDEQDRRLGHLILLRMDIVVGDIEDGMKRALRSSLSCA